MPLVSEFDASLIQYPISIFNRRGVPVRTAEFGGAACIQYPPPQMKDGTTDPLPPAFWLGPGKRMGHHDFYSDSME
jgi:hypothetical protein